MSDQPRYTQPGFLGLAGAARGDITPPPGIYARNWGAATTEQASGVHRPLTATALVLGKESGGAPHVLLALDLGWWRNAVDAERFHSGLLEELGLPEASLIVNLGHTHAGPVLSSACADRPGGEMVAGYLETVQQVCRETVERALKQMRPAVVTWRTGSCRLAKNRDFPDPADPQRILCGWNPDGEADDTLLVGDVREFGGDGAPIAILVNYACHPTTLAWDNPLLSPDFPGAMRETVEGAHPGALTLFLQGASGELAPAEQYSGDPALADRHGRHLGYSVLACLEDAPRADHGLTYGGFLPSGAPLARWRAETISGVNRTLTASILPLKFRIKPDFPRLDALREALHECTDPVEAERLRRKIGVREMVGDSPEAVQKVWVWRLGDAWVIAQANEAYSLLQRSLRKGRKSVPVLVLNLSNGGSCGYLPPKDLYGSDQYAVWQTPFAEGSLEHLIESVTRSITD